VFTVSTPSGGLFQQPAKPRKAGRLRLGRLATIILALAAVAIPFATVHAGDIGILVPAYFRPGTGGTEGYTDGWAKMAASARNAEITAIFNPDGGPLPDRDPGYAAAMTKPRPRQDRCLRQCRLRQRPGP
jgi:hypothetical protein